MRTWLHQRLVTSDALRDLLFADADAMPANAEDSIYGSHSIENVPTKKPFIVHNMGNDTSASLGEGSRAHRQYIIIYVHDEGNDYTRIDDIISELINLLDDAPGSAEFGVLTAHYLETSQDLEDDQMGTIVKYARFQIIGA